MEDEEYVSDDTQEQDNTTERLIDTMVLLVHELQETKNLRVCLDIVQANRDLLFINGIFIKEFREIAEDYR